ncbi:MAG: electron transfer flavoprotein subunit beta/FixA family protein [Bacteroidetes bacterium]|nr:electron transfer flavoprotein subunit beta/FixA family protein [Bacteroidota bacterium]
MKILVCINNVPDTTTKIKFVNNTAFDAAGVQWIINPWDELALTRAIEIKEAQPAAVETITVVNVGLAEAEPTIRKALAIGADNGVRINYDAKDSYTVAYLLAEYIKKENYEIILCGIESSDYNGANVGGMLSEMLDLPSVSSVSFLDIKDGKLMLKREIDGGQETVATQLPFVGIVQKGIAKEPKIPSMRGIMTARTKQLQVIEGVSTENLTDFVEFELPKPKAACKKIDPENVRELVQLLHNEAKVI